MVCVVRDEARAPKTVHCFLHQMTLTNQRGAQLRQLTLKGRGSVSRLSGAYLKPKESDSMEKTKCEKSRSTSNPGLLETGCRR